MAARHERPPVSTVCRKTYPCCRWRPTAHPRQGTTAHAGEEAWLVGEWRSNGERKYYLSNLPADTTLKQLAGAIKARWVCEQAHQQMKEELGLDHFEGRSWKGLHRHALMTMIAYTFLQHHRLQIAKREKKEEVAAIRTA